LHFTYYHHHTHLWLLSDAYFLSQYIQCMWIYMCFVYIHNFLCINLYIICILLLCTRIQICEIMQRIIIIVGFDKGDIPNTLSHTLYFAAFFTIFVFTYIQAVNYVYPCIIYWSLRFSKQIQLTKSSHWRWNATLWLITAIECDSHVPHSFGVFHYAYAFYTWVELFGTTALIFGGGNDTSKAQYWGSFFMQGNR
jgi:hypothetical protein